MGSKKACEHYWKPFKIDCEDLLGCFQQTESVRYEEFSEIWRAMDFSSVFYGNQSHHEKKSFTRLTFTIVYNYFLPPYSFQIRVGALYMLYGLYNKQVVWPKEKVRVALKDWFHIQQFIAEAKMCQHLDVVYIFCSLLSDKAFNFTAMPKKKHKRRYFEKYLSGPYNGGQWEPMLFGTNHFQNIIFCVLQKKESYSDRVQHDVNEDFRARRDKVAELASAEMLEEIANVHGHYARMKNSLLPPSAGVTLQNLAGAVKKCTLEYKQWQEKIAAAKIKDSTKEANLKSESSNRADLLAAIKSKSYGHLTKESKSRRHRQIKMVTTGFGTEVLFGRKKKPPSLRARTYRTLGNPGETEPTQQWLLSVMEEDKNALKRRDLKRFNWSEMEL